MDPITHGLAGAAIANLGFKRKAVLWVLILSSIVADLDFITRFWGADVLLRYHRGITHGILALFVVPILIGLIFGYKKGFFYYSLVAFLGYSSHLFMDLTNQYGTRILSPLDWEQFSLDLIFIIDPYITIGFLLSVILCKVSKKRAITIALITIFLLVGYTCVRYYLQNKTMDFLKSNLVANLYKMYPLPNDFLRWWFVVKSGNEVKVGFADLFTRRICMQETYKISEQDLFIEMSKKERIVKNFLYFAKYPYAHTILEKGKVIVVWRELTFSFMSGDHFVAKVVFDEEGKVLDSYLKF